MVYVDLYSNCRSNVLYTLVPRELPSFQSLFEGDIVLLYSEVVGQRVSYYRAMHSECLVTISVEPVSWHHHQLLCG